MTRTLEDIKKQKTNLEQMFASLTPEERAAVLKELEGEN